jgi:hypothetical protein
MSLRCVANEKREDNCGDIPIRLVRERTFRGQRLHSSVQDLPCLAETFGLPNTFNQLSCSAYSTLETEEICSSETSVDFNGLHDVVSQKQETCKILCTFSDNK